MCVCVSVRASMTPVYDACLWRPFQPLPVVGFLWYLQGRWVLGTALGASQFQGCLVKFNVTETYAIIATDENHKPSVLVFRKRQTVCKNRTSWMRWCALAPSSSQRGSRHQSKLSFSTTRPLRILYIKVRLGRGLYIYASYTCSAPRILFLEISQKGWILKNFPNDRVCNNDSF